MCHRVRLRAYILAISLLALPVARAQAQPYLAPFVGVNIGGDAGCQTLTACEGQTSSVGLAVGTSNVLVGFEEEFGYARHFFGDGPGRGGNVLTLMSNLVVGPRIGVVHPYGVIGLGLIKTRVDLSLDGLATSDSSLGWNIGGGLELGGARVGVRGDMRYIHAVHDLGLPGLPFTDLRLDFGRASAGLVLRF